MALKQSSEALRRPTRWLYVAFPVITIGSLILGLIGLHQFLQGNPDYGHRVIDFVYYDLQLFVLGSDPLQTHGPYPLPLDIARFSAPAVTIYTVVEAIRRSLAVELSRLRARRAHGHAIVCGDSALADALTRRLRRDGKDVVEIRTEPDEFVTPGEPIRIIGDARDPEVLRSAGVDHAITVYACAVDSATNIAVAMAVARTIPLSGERVSTYSLVSDPDFCATVQASFLGQSANGRVRSDFFNIDHIAARRLFRDDHLVPIDGRPPRVLVAGTDGFARALVVEAARIWRSGHPDGEAPLPVTLVGDNALEVLLELQHRYPMLSTACQFETIQGDLLGLIQRGRMVEPPDHALITYVDEEFALKTAMTAERYWRDRTGKITVRLDGALIGLPSDGELRPSVTPGKLRAFSAIGAAADPDLIRDDLTERIARVLHERYVRGRRAREQRASGRAMVSWDNLPSRLRQANRSQAEDIGRKLAGIGYTIAPRHVEERAATLSAAEIDQLAAMEHARWCHEQESAGWRYAPELDEQKKLHPGLVRWENLDPVMRMRNYDPVQDLPAILGDAGFQIVRA